MLIFNDERTNTTSEIFEHKGGSIQVQVLGLNNGVVTPGTLNGITVQMKARQDNLDYQDLSSGDFTQPDLLVFEAKANTDFIFEITGQSADFGITLSVI